MRHLILVFSLLLGVVYAQTEKSCCSMEATDAFAKMGDEQDFRMKHELPVAYEHTAAMGKTITFETPDGKEAQAYAVMSEEETQTYVLMIHEWWGLNDNVKREADQLVKELGAVNVLALDLYDGNVASTREDAQKYMQSVKTERAQAIISGAIAMAGEEARFFTIGWCFGGGWSLQSSLLAGEQAAGCVIYYGMPEQDVEKLRELDTEVLGIFATQDRWINEEVVNSFKNNMAEADKDLTVHMFEADHAFANPSSPRYKEEDAQMAYALTLDFFRERMQ